MKRKIVTKGRVASCYFRSSTKFPYRKALLQITEKCNLYCAHCFVSSGSKGVSMSLKEIYKIVIPRLKQCRVISVTLTGGEPFMHEDIIEIVQLLRAADMSVSICTNGTIVNQAQIKDLAKIGYVHLNVSLDGFRPESHGKFRGDKNAFAKTVKTICLLAKYHLLKGLLVTPNNFAEVSEYADICEFAIKNGATYVLMNPLSSMGRGVKSENILRSPDKMMNEIKKITDPYRNFIDIVNIRFPNKENLPLSACEAGNIIYVFTRGEVAVCAYLVFAARTPQSKHKQEEFIVGNIFKDIDIAKRLNDYNIYKQYQIGNNQACQNCSLNYKCKKGCLAAVVMSGEKIGAVDQKVCPITTLMRNK